MPLDPEFVEHCLYDAGGLLIDEVVAVDEEASSITVQMPTHADLPITRHQRVSERHPRHVSGGLMIHMTGIVADAHFHYVLGLRHTNGWTGYGVRIHNARFRNLAEPGAPMHLTCTALKIRRIGERINARYKFEFTQGDKLVYEGEQTAMWIRHPTESAEPPGSA